MTPRLVSLTVYIAAIVAANVLTNAFGLVPIGFGLVTTAGTFAAGFALLTRDFVHRYGGVPWVLAGIAVGILLSWFMASPALAVASTAAFLLAELADMLVYIWLRPKGFIAAAGWSNVVSAPVDTVAFLAIAGFPLTVQTVGGQLIGKLMWATAVPLGIYWLATRRRVAQAAA